MVESYFVEFPKKQGVKGPVGVLPALINGFDRTAANPALIIPPLLLDLLLWLGPRIRITAIIQDFSQSLLASPGAELINGEQLAVFTEMTTVLGERYNVLSSLSTLPAGMPFNLMFALLASFLIGVPSLMATRMPILSPFGSPGGIEITQYPELLYSWLLLSLLGLGLGAFYHRRMAQVTSGERKVGSILSISWRIAVLTGGAMLVLFLIFGVSALFASEAVIVYLVIPISFLAGIYFIFTPHGIVRYRYGILKSIRESVRLVRFNFLAAVGFILFAFLIMWLTTMEIWSLPDEESWFTILAILGHAFVSAVLLVSSYVFFQGRHEWMLSQSAMVDALVHPAPSTSEDTQDPAARCCLEIRQSRQL